MNELLFLYNAHSHLTRNASYEDASVALGVSFLISTGISSLFRLHHCTVQYPSPIHRFSPIHPPLLYPLASTPLFPFHLFPEQSQCLPTAFLSRSL